MNTNVSKWRTAVAVTMGGAMLATSAITESGAGSPSAPRGAKSIKAIQQALKDNGHDPGEVDGAMGPRTRAALRDYQQKEGLKATGTPDAETTAKLAAAVSTESSDASSATGTSKDSFTGVTQTR